MARAAARAFALAAALVVTLAAAASACTPASTWSAHAGVLTYALDSPPVATNLLIPVTLSAPAFDLSFMASATALAANLHFHLGACSDVPVTFLPFTVDSLHAGRAQLLVLFPSLTAGAQPLCALFNRAGGAASAVPAAAALASPHDDASVKGYALVWLDFSSSLETFESATAVAPGAVVGSGLATVTGRLVLIAHLSAASGALAIDTAFTSADATKPTGLSLSSDVAGVAVGNTGAARLVRVLLGTAFNVDASDGSAPGFSAQLVAVAPAPGASVSTLATIEVTPEHTRVRVDSMLVAALNGTVQGAPIGVSLGAPVSGALSSADYDFLRVRTSVDPTPTFAWAPAPTSTVCMAFTTLSPSSGATGVPRAATIIATFTFAPSVASTSALTVVRTANSAAVPGTVWRTGGALMWMPATGTLLEPSTSYTARLALASVSSDYGQSLATTGLITSVFTTGAAAPPPPPPPSPPTGTSPPPTPVPSPAPVPPSPPSPSPSVADGSAATATSRRIPQTAWLMLAGLFVIVAFGAVVVVRHIAKLKPVSRVNLDDNEIALTDSIGASGSLSNGVLKSAPLIKAAPSARAVGSPVASAWAGAAGQTANASAGSSARARAGTTAAAAAAGGQPAAAPRVVTGVPRSRGGVHAAGAGVGSSAADSDGAVRPRTGPSAARKHDSPTGVAPVTARAPVAAAAAGNATAVAWAARAAPATAAGAARVKTGWD